MQLEVHELDIHALSGRDRRSVSRHHESQQYAASAVATRVPGAGLGPLPGGGGEFYGLMRPQSQARDNG
jgi:hypothetical protein